MCSCNLLLCDLNIGLRADVEVCIVPSLRSVYTSPMVLS